jgi:thiopeptide-type bacteriocin biosynthesis protein
VRLRLRGDPAGLVTRVLPALHEAARSLRDDGRLWRIQLDTYEREVERYGGDAGIALAEALFEADSDAVLSVLDVLQSEGGDHARWRLALRGVHLLLVDLGLDLAQRTEVMRRSRATFGAEHRVDATLKKQLGDRFRRERPSLEELLAARPVAARAAGDDVTPVVEAALERGFDQLAGRSARLVSVSRELADHAARAALDASVAELAPSFVHMHVNRLLRSEHRAQELVLYDFLLRLYESEAARHRAPRGGERAP